MNQDMFDPEIFSEFVIEAREHLDSIEPSLLELEKDPGNLKLLDDIFRPMHSLKGASGFLGLNVINALAHNAENFLDALRKGNLSLSTEIMDVVLEATDKLRQLIDNLEQSSQEGDVETATTIATINGLLSGECSPPEQAAGGIGIPVEDNGQCGAYSLTLVSPEHLSDFMEESREIIQSLNASLLEMEKSPDNEGELVREAFRCFHNLKGNSGIAGYAELNRVTHEAETLLNIYRTRESIPERPVLDLLLQVVDTIESLVSRVDPGNGRVEPFDVSRLAELLQQTVQCSRERVLEETPAPAPDPSGQTEAPPEDVEDLKIFEQTAGQQFNNIDFALQSLRQDSCNRELIDGLFRSLVSLQNAAAYMGLEDIAVTAERTANLVDQARKTDLDFEMLQDMLEQEASILRDMVEKALQQVRGKSVDRGGGEDKTAEPGKDAGPRSGAFAEADAEAGSRQPEELAAQPGQSVPGQKARPALPSDAAQPAAKTRIQTSSTIRVDHEKLDHLMNLIGELIINRNRYALLAKELQGRHGVVEIAQQLTETTYSMARISDDLQDTIMKVRMVPVKTVFSRFPRLVRDLSRKSEKRVELITEGEETELDKSVVEVIGDPLVHLIRNAVDHGLENEEQRLGAGKDPVGRVWLRAYHQGNSVIIEIQDDGRGIDPEKMRTIAVDKGLISDQEARSLDDREARELIFAPGFSTAEKITDISGRGVGMDVVRNNIKELKGSIGIQSELGKGSTFILSLPLTLAIIEALMVTVCGDTYAIPLDAVSETTKIATSRLTEVNKRKAVTLRGDVLGIVDLAEVLGLPDQKQERDVLPIVIMSVNDRRLGLVVDSLLERQEVVIKSMGNYLGNLQGISGATIMGDGSVVLILDPGEIFLLSTTRAAVSA